MALKPNEKSQLQHMHDNLATHIAEINLLSQTEVEFNKLEHLINQKQLKIGSKKRSEKETHLSPMFPDFGAIMGSKMDPKSVRRVIKKHTDF